MIRTSDYMKIRTMCDYTVFVLNISKFNNTCERPSTLKVNRPQAAEPLSFLRHVLPQWGEKQYKKRSP